MYQLTVYLHLLAAVVWVGGIVFLATVAVPLARQLDQPLRTRVISEAGRRFRAIGWASLAVLLVTGIINMGYRGATLENTLNGTFWATPFGRTLAEKLALVALMAMVSAVHDFVIGPRSVRLAQEGKDIASLRITASWLARITLLLALVILFLAVMLVRPGLLR